MRKLTKKQRPKEHGPLKEKFTLTVNFLSPESRWKDSYWTTVSRDVAITSRGELVYVGNMSWREKDIFNEPEMTFENRVYQKSYNYISHFIVNRIERRISKKKKIYQLQIKKISPIEKISYSNGYMCPAATYEVEVEYYYYSGPIRKGEWEESRKRAALGAGLLCLTAGVLNQARRTFGNRHEK